MTTATNILKVHQLQQKSKKMTEMKLFINWQIISTQNILGNTKQQPF